MSQRASEASTRLAAQVGGPAGVGAGEPVGAFVHEQRDVTDVAGLCVGGPIPTARAVPPVDRAGRAGHALFGGAGAGAQPALRGGRLGSAIGSRCRQQRPVGPAHGRSDQRGGSSSCPLPVRHRWVRASEPRRGRARRHPRRRRRQQHRLRRPRRWEGAPRGHRPYCTGAAISSGAEGALHGRAEYPGTSSTRTVRKA
jgi:hypothetical protein